MQTNNQIKFQPDLNIKPDGIYLLSDFQHFYDRSFVRSAYLAIFRREPDSEGESYYLNRIRKGISKNLILAQMMKSPEARKYKTKISGLWMSVFVEKTCSIPILGTLLLAAMFLLNIKNHLKDLRVLENHVIRMAEETQTINQESIASIRTALENLKSR